MKQSLRDLFGFRVGKLPMQYLGVPMISTKLTYSGCLALIERITALITSWICTFLSYAGRLRLLKAMLFSIQSYRCAHFVLPSTVTKRIEQLLRNFLWTGKE